MDVPFSFLCSKFLIRYNYGLGFVIVIGSRIKTGQR
jgi:hypothetical protein